MKILHVPDIHYPDARLHAEWQGKALASLAVLAETAEREQARLVTIPGDLFDAGIQNSQTAGFPKLLDAIQRILDVCPIAAVSGTPSHDPAGAYIPLTKLRGKDGQNFVMIQPGKACFLDSFNGCIHGDFIAGQTELLIIGTPEITREWILAGKEGATGEEISEALKTGARAILLGTGALRAQRPDLACAFLFHGPVSGAAMQNGQVIGAGSITIGREDLQLVASDITAWYGGNAYPKDYGELGQVGFNLVDLQPGETFGFLGDIHLCQEVVKGREISVTRIDYPHPRRVKFSLPWPEPAGDVEGVQAWICYRATKEEAAKIDTASYLNSYLLAGALPGSRVTVELIPTETVRAAEITEKHRLAEKLEVYDEASGMGGTLKPSVLAKCEQLEREAEERGAAAGMHFRLRRLRLRGAIGVWKGQRKDEVDYDLDTFSPGLIAMVGVNGSSKSTVIENMHPYPCMLTREGKLQDHFRLRDSARELWFVDERTGTEYRALMEIDGANATGLAKYHLFKAGEPINSGAKLSKDDYQAAIEVLIGTLPLFLRSAFVSQRPTKSNPDLSEATKGERKAIFRELAGLDYMQAYAENAKGKAGAIEAEISVERGRISFIENQLTALPELVQDRSQKAEDLAHRQNGLRTLELRGLSLKSDVEQLAQKVAEQRSLAERIAGLNDQVAQKQQVVKLAAESIVGYQEALDWAPDAQKVIAEWDVLKEQENAENRRLGALNADNARLQGEYTARLTAHNADVRKVEGLQSGLRTEKASLEGARNVLQAQIDHLSGDIKEPAQAFDGTCFNCGKVLEGAQLEEERKKHSDKVLKRAEIEQKVENFTEKREKNGQQVAAIEQQLAAITLPPALPPLELAPVDQAPLRRILGAQAALKIDQARKNVTQAQEAATRIEEAEKQKILAETELGTLEWGISLAKKELDATIQPAYDQAARKLEAARTEYGDAQKAVAALEAQLQGMDKRIAELHASEKDLGERKVTMEERQACAAEWRYLEGATGPDGIQALELDAMGPGISEVANRLLSAAYGSRFSIELRTTRIAGKGAKTKQVEDFAIIVLDNELLTEQPIETLSGGESVWIKQAIYAAFSIIRDKMTGIRFLTCFKDECDGALDPESRAKYFQMLEAEHNESGRRHTLIITHSESAQEMIQQRIEMRRAS